MQSTRRSWWCGFVGSILLVSILLAPFAGVESAADGIGDEIDDERILESSGVVASPRVENRFWTHNDSGDPARLFALDQIAEGRSQGDRRPGGRAEGGRAEGGRAKWRVSAVDVRGARSIDWEDIAAGVIDGRPTLIIADVGDNARRRDHVTLYVIDEPTLADEGATAQGEPQAVAPRFRQADVRQRIDVRYPDGPTNCEAIAVDAPRRRVILISKQVLPTAAVYAVPIPAEEDDPQGVVAERIGNLPMPMVTGMDIRDDGRRLAVVGYFDLFLFDRDGNEDWAEALRRTPVHVALPKLKQIEAVGFDRQGEVWITSEGNPMPIARLSSSAKGRND